jgi:transcriptional regulator with XRE-family HTH domain
LAMPAADRQGAQITRLEAWGPCAKVGRNRVLSCRRLEWSDRTKGSTRWQAAPAPKSMTELDLRRVARAFGAVVKSTPTNAGISQEKLAEFANIDRTCPSMLERGLRQPTLGRVIAIANALHIEPTAIVAATVTRLRPDSATRSFFVAGNVYALDCGVSGRRGGRSLRPGTRTVNI